MNRNVRIAKELVRLAKTLVASCNFANLKNTGKIKFSNATDTSVDFSIKTEGEYTHQGNEGKGMFKGERQFEDFEVEGTILKENLNNGKEKYTIKVKDYTPGSIDSSLFDEYSKPQYGMRDFGGPIGEVGDFFKSWGTEDVSKEFSSEENEERVNAWIMEMLNLAVEIAEDCANQIARTNFLNELDDSVAALIDDDDFGDDEDNY